MEFKGRCGALIGINYRIINNPLVTDQVTYIQACHMRPYICGYHSAINFMCSCNILPRLKHSGSEWICTQIEQKDGFRSQSIFKKESAKVQAQHELFYTILSQMSGKGVSTMDPLELSYFNLT